MNEVETRAEHIDPSITAAGWGVVDGSCVLREHHITLGRLERGGCRARPLIADYVLVYRGHKLGTRFAHATTGHGVYGADMHTGGEGARATWPTPDELWRLTFAASSEWRNRFSAVPHEDTRYHRTSPWIACSTRSRRGVIASYLMLATGRRKSREAVSRAVEPVASSGAAAAAHPVPRRPGHNAFSAFSEDALVRVEPKVRHGVHELDEVKLAPLLRLRYHASIADALADLGPTEAVRGVFSEFQQYLYLPRAA